MGRWSQRRHCGGGTPAAVPIAHLSSASITDVSKVDALYNIDISSLTFTPAAFMSSPSGSVGTSATISGSNQVTLNFSGIVSTDTDLLYTGSDAGLQTPDSVSY